MNIKTLSLKDKQTLLAMLQASLGMKIEVEFKADKRSFYQTETAKCNEIARIKKSGQSVIYTEFQMVD